MAGGARSEQGGVRPPAALDGLRAMNHAMWAYVLVWALLTVAAGFASSLLRQQIIDDIERDLPLDARLSWGPQLKLRKWPTALLRIHAQKYPASRLWTAYRITKALFYALALSGFIAMAIRNSRR